MKPHSSASAESSSSDGSTSKRSGERGGDKRERILDAAERVFARAGFFQSRVSEIARDAGVADGTIYLYFKSKDDLLISVFESRMERINDHLARALEGLATPPDKLNALLRSYLGLVNDFPELAEVLTIELRQSSKFMKEYANPRFGDFLKLVASVVAEGQERGDFAAAIPPAHVARMVFGILDELALVWLLGRGESFDIATAADWVCLLVMDGLKPRAQARYPSPSDAERDDDDGSSTPEAP
ncbi:TetR/AcrR family transcriptional regulator [Haliangium ochraceum]|uniref:Transcriptional regulator, TetR family n=1 Tax=Haliangium ochraceum (strain DSM 14365 / JCM 11303 / SMP-2) TaxID=502025 RepID=D0LRQ4_HALO1|nr:TetR/AcrR family transcriptional regulator [Haliangium ochraceum]ACY19046.1 transcriptional regulator, TetR family [Haliangium ochraceum DSM 14365]